MIGKACGDILRRIVEWYYRSVSADHHSRSVRTNKLAPLTNIVHTVFTFFGLKLYLED